MVKTRSAKGNTKSPPNTAGTKRAATAPTSSSRTAKRGKTSKKKEQTAIEKSMNGIEDDKGVEKQIKGEKRGDTDEKKGGIGGNGDTTENNDGLKDGQKNAFGEVKSDEAEVIKSAQEEQETKTTDISKNNESIANDEREAKTPSSILEKGIVYFFFRGRVNVEDPQGIEDVARSYIILRPIPLGAKLGDGPLEDLGTSRLLVMPKKMMPKSTRDRFLVFVEKPKATIEELRKQFQGSDYSTKTAGTSHVPPATPFAEGVYAITRTGRESHLAYEITTPEIGELQKDFGVKEKGSYVLSVKNPKFPGPANANIGNPAKYPEQIQRKFKELGKSKELRWVPLEPEMLDYEHTQVLIIGEKKGIFGKMAEEMSKDQKDDGKEKPEKELEQLEDEDRDRVDHLKESEPVFADLGLSAKEYSKMKSTW